MEKINIEELQRFCAKGQTVHHTKLTTVLKELEAMYRANDRLKEKLAMMEDILSRKTLTGFEKEQIKEAKRDG